MSLHNRTVLVIGRGSGLAHAVVSAAREAGARVVVAGRNVDALKAAYTDPDIAVEHLDLTDEATIVGVAQRLGDVDHVVSTGSARARGFVGELDPEAVNRSFATKVVGPMLLAKHFAPLMPADGSFVFFSGAAALKAKPGFLAVGATNAAVNNVVRTLAVELGPIRVNAVSPGTVDTGAYDGMGDNKAEYLAACAAHTPAGRNGTSEDVAGAVMFALTTPFLTGTVINIDGGETLA